MIYIWGSTKLFSFFAVHLLGESNSAKFTQEFIRVDACLKTDTRYIRAWLAIVVELGP